MTLALPVVLMALILGPAPDPEIAAPSLTAPSLAPWSTAPSRVASMNTHAHVGRATPISFQRGSTGNFRGVRATRATVIIVATVIGMVAGGLTGSALDGDCACDSPGMAGFVVGAPIGGLLGAVVAVHLTR
jgi:hypothetical protein